MYDLRESYHLALELSEMLADLLNASNKENLAYRVRQCLGEDGPQMVQQVDQERIGRLSVDQRDY